MPITNQKNMFCDRSLDAYTGELLPKHLIRVASEDDMNDLNSKAWKLNSIDQCMKVPDHVLVSSRWVMCSKCDADHPKRRARLVSCELDKGGRNDMFPAPTPRFEGKRLLFTRHASERPRKGKPLRLSLID